MLSKDRLLQVTLHTESTGKYTLCVALSGGLGLGMKSVSYAVMFKAFHGRTHATRRVIPGV